MKILITGISGTIGTFLAPALARDHDVYGIDLRPSDWPNAVQADYGLDISRLPVFVKEEVPKLLASVGAERLVFGSGMPITSVEVPIYKLEVLDVPDAVKEQIRWQNATRLLGEQV